MEKYSSKVLIFLSRRMMIYTQKSDDLLLEKEQLVFCYQNCSDLLWEKIVVVIKKKLKFEAEGREFAKKNWDH